MFGIENVFTFVLNFFFFCIWIGNESKDHVSPYLVRIHQLGRVESGTGRPIGFLQNPRPISYLLPKFLDLQAIMCPTSTLLLVRTLRVSHVPILWDNLSSNYFLVLLGTHLYFIKSSSTSIFEVVISLLNP